MLKAAVLGGAGESEAAYAREQLREVSARATSKNSPTEDSPTAAYALAISALVERDDDAAVRWSRAMRGASEAFDRAADAIDALAQHDAPRYAGALEAIVRDFEQRSEHLTGVAIADTALMFEQLAARRGMAAHVSSPLLPALSHGARGGPLAPLGPRRARQVALRRPRSFVFTPLSFCSTGAKMAAVDGSDIEIEEQVRRFGQRLRERRTEAGLSQLALAKRAGVDLAAVSFLERAKRAPNLNTLVRVARAANVTPATLLEDDRYPQRCAPRDRPARRRPPEALRREPAQRARQREHVPGGARARGEARPRGDLDHRAGNARREPPHDPEARTRAARTAVLAARRDRLTPALEAQLRGADSGARRRELALVLAREPVAQQPADRAVMSSRSRASAMSRSSALMISSSVSVAGAAATRMCSTTAATASTSSAPAGSSSLWSGSRPPALCENTTVNKVTRGR